MEGFDSEWLYAGTQNSAAYTNLDPGKYVFRVKASNNDGIWNEQGFLCQGAHSATLVVNLVVQGFMAVFIVAAIFLVIRIRTNSIKKQKEILD